MRPRPFILTTSIVAVLLTGSAPTVFAATNWVGNTSNDFTDAANWSNGGPGGQDAYIGIPGSGVGGVTAPFTATLSNAAANITLVDLQVARNSGNGVFNQTAGTLSTGAGNWGDIGTNSGTGIYNLANVNTTGGTLTGFGQGSGSFNAGRLYVGGTGFGTGGNGTMNINTSGTITTSDETDVGVSGGGAVGVLKMDNGTFTFGNRIWIGRGAGSTGTVSVGGGLMRANSADGNNARFYIGDGGTGTLNVSGTATMTALNDFDLGSNGGSGTVVQSGGTVNVGGWMKVGNDEGNNGTGSLTVTGGTMNTGRFVLGLNNNTSGTALVNGAAAVLNLNDEVWVGQGAGSTGQMTVSAGTVNVASWLAVGRGGSNGTLTINGGLVSKANANGKTELTNGGGSATLNLNGGTFLTNQIAFAGGATATVVMNFNGGTLKPFEDDGDFIANNVGSGILNVKAGGAVIDTNGKNITIQKPFVPDAVSTGGGLAKNGLGNLTLTQTSTYTGATTVNAGTLIANVGGTVGTIGGNGAIVVNSGGNLQSGSTDALGYYNHTAANSITVNAGGTLTAGDGKRFSMDRTLNVAGGSAGNGDGTPNSYNFTSSAGGAASLVSATHVGLGGNVTFNVTDGPGVLELNVTGDFVDNFGVGSLIKAGSGVMAIANTSNAYTGTTTVSAGQLTVTAAGSLPTTSGVSVAANATLRVDGTVNTAATTTVLGRLQGTGTLGAVNVTGGLLAAGNSIGTLNTGALSLTSPSTFQLELAIASPASFTTDLTNVLGNLSLGNSTLSTLDIGGTNFATKLTNGTVITFLDYSGIWDSSTFAGMPDDSLFTRGANTFRISYNGVNNNDTAVTIQSVPEPTTALSLLSGIGMLVSLQRFRRRS